MVHSSKKSHKLCFHFSFPFRHLHDIHLLLKGASVSHQGRTLEFFMIVLGGRFSRTNCPYCLQPTLLPHVSSGVRCFLGFWLLVDMFNQFCILSTCFKGVSGIASGKYCTLPQKKRCNHAGGWQLVNAPSGTSDWTTLLN